MHTSTTTPRSRARVSVHSIRKCSIFVDLCRLQRNGTVEGLVVEQKSLGPGYLREISGPKCTLLYYYLQYLDLYGQRVYGQRE